MANRAKRTHKISIMKTSTKFISAGSRTVGIAVVGLLLLAVSPLVSLAQDAPEAAKAEAKAEPKADKKPAAEKGDGEKLEGVDLVMDRARLLMDKLKGRERKVDPFGMSMDPENAHVIAEEIEDAPRQVTSLEEAVARFRVSGVVPSRKEVIVGARSLGIGDKVLIEHREVRFQLVIVEVTPHKISLKDTETGEIAGVDLGIVPGMLPTSVAGQGAPAPGAGISPMSADFQVE